MLIVALLVKTFSHYGPDVSQDPATGFCPELHSISLRSILTLSLIYALVSQVFFLFQVFRLKLCTHCHLCMHVTCSAHLILIFVGVLMFGEQHKFMLAVFKFFYPPVSNTPSGPYILPSPLLSVLDVPLT
jgi:hypothetical protein